MGRARLNKGTKKRVITSVERQIVCFSVGSPLQRHLPTTKWAVHPKSSAKLRNPETIAKTFHLVKIHSNDTPTLHADSRQKLVYYLAKTETFSTKFHCFIHRRPIRPHFLLVSTLFCPSTRAYAHSANFRFLPSPFTTRDISLILGELGVKAMPSNAFTRLKKFPAHPKRAKKHRERRPHFPLLAAFTLIFTLNALYINPMQGTNFVLR